MRLLLRRILPVLAVALLALTVDGHRVFAPVNDNYSAFAKEKPAAPKAMINHGHVYLMRGLGNIWSRGINQLGEKLEAQGVRVSVHNHRYWKELAAEAAEKYKTQKDFAPIIIMGHSLGASATVLMAQKIGQYGVPVRLIVAFDALAHTAKAQAKVSANVMEALNLYNGKVLGMEMIPGRGFKGKIENFDVRDVKDAGHLKIDKNPELHARVIALVLEILAEKPGKR